MNPFKQKADAFLHAQQNAKDTPTPANQKRLEDARRALKATPQAKAARDSMAWRTSPQGSSPEWRQR